jgi:putative transposase
METSDETTPAAMIRARVAPSRLSMWWIRLGIGIERIVPGRPEQNGAHERMH